MLALRVRLAKAEREAGEARDEMLALRANSEERASALEAALEAERKARPRLLPWPLLSRCVGLPHTLPCPAQAHSVAVHTLEGVHVDAGMHEAQEMVRRGASSARPRCLEASASLPSHSRSVPLIRS